MKIELTSQEIISIYSALNLRKKQLQSLENSANSEGWDFQFYKADLEAVETAMKNIINTLEAPFKN